MTGNFQLSWKRSKSFLNSFLPLKLSYFSPMKSIATRHFPRFVYSENEKFLFNPVLKKRLKNRPEERVRLKWVEYLLSQTDYPKSRIGFEAPVRLRQEPNALRADLILYTREMKPSVLIECKAESIPLTQATAEQAARYNTKLNAPYICLTNGISDYWFRKEGNKISPAEPAELPLNEVHSHLETARDYSYWQQRGFCPPDFLHRDLLVQVLSRFWSDRCDWPVQYLNFRDTPLHSPLDHYYRIPNVGSRTRLAISFIGNARQPATLAAILNQNGTNLGLLTINLNKLAQEEADSATLFSNGGEIKLDASRHLSLFSEMFIEELDKQLPHTLMKFFD
jgi:hypothetical protein